MLIIAVKHQC